MARFNTKAAKAQPTSRVTSTGRVLRTYQGGRGRERDERSELFLLSLANFVAQKTFYESGEDRDDRFAALVRRLAVTDPAWTAGLLGWLRGEGNLRTAAIVGAAEYVKARLDANATDGPTNRQVVESVLRRPDEPGELLAYWTSRYGRNIPKPVKRGIADAVRRLYSAQVAAEVRHRRPRATASATSSTSCTRRRTRTSRGRASCSSTRWTGATTRTPPSSPSRCPCSPHTGT